MNLTTAKVHHKSADKILEFFFPDISRYKITPESSTPEHESAGTSPTAARKNIVFLIFLYINDI